MMNHSFIIHYANTGIMGTREQNLEKVKVVHPVLCETEIEIETGPGEKGTFTQTPTFSGEEEEEEELGLIRNLFHQVCM